jgi:hypothetical protein
MERGVVEIDADVTLVAVDGVVNGFQNRIAEKKVHLALTPDRRLTDGEGTTTWDLRGKRIDGHLPDLTPVPISDEYWFSWKRFHPDTTLARLESATAGSPVSEGAQDDASPTLSSRASTPA